MPTTPIRYASSADGNTGTGAAWNTPTGANAVGGSTSNLLSNVLGAGFSSARLRVINFPDFATDIPSGATIDGIEVIVAGFSSTTDFISISEVYLQKAGVDAGSNGVVSTQLVATAGGSSRTYGGVANLWGTTWSRADLINAQFAAFIRAYNGSPKFANLTRIDLDSIGVRVTYTGGSGGGGGSGASAIAAAVASQKLGMQLRIGV